MPGAGLRVAGKNSQKRVKKPTLRSSDIDQLVQRLSLEDNYWWYILYECEDLAAIPEQYQTVHKAMLKENTANSPLNSQFNPLKFFTHKASFSMLSAIGVASTPIDIFWIVVSFAALGAAGLVLSGAVASVALLLGLMTFIYYYQKTRKVAKEHDKFFKLAVWQEKAANELRNAHDKKPNSCQPDTALEALPSSSSLENIEQESVPLIAGERQAEDDQKLELPPGEKAESMLVALSTMITLFGTFFWGTADMLTTLGFVTVGSMLSGPIGLAVAAGVTVAIGLYLGYKYYKKSQTDALIEQEKAEITKNVHEERGYCRRMLEEKYQPKQGVAKEMQQVSQEEPRVAPPAHPSPKPEPKPKEEQLALHPDRLFTPKDHSLKQPQSTSLEIASPTHNAR